MDWQEIEVALTACNVGRLRGLLIGRRNLWNYHYETCRRRSVPAPYLHMAALSSQNAVEMIQVLVRARMDINVQDREGQTALHSILRVLTSQNQRSNIDVVSTLLHLGCDPSIEDESGETVLHILAKKPSNHDVSQLIERLFSRIQEDQRSIYVKALDKRGKSAISYALDHSAFDRIHQLLRMVGVSFVGDSTGRAILHGVLRKVTNANESEVRRVVMMLLERGCDLTARDERGQTALHILAKYGRLSDHHRIAKGMILHLPKSERSAFLDMQDENGDTALHTFVKKSMFFPKSKSSIVSLFLDHGVDPTIGNNEGNLPLSFLGDSHSFNATTAFLLLENMMKQSFFQ